MSSILILIQLAITIEASLTHFELDEPSLHPYQRRENKNESRSTLPVKLALVELFHFLDYCCARIAIAPAKTPMPTAAVCIQPAPPVLLLVADKDVDVESTAD